MNGIYTYDSLGQVTGGHKKWSDNSSVDGQQYDYVFDDIGNRKTATVNGNVGTYTANSLNQYTQRTVPGAVWELGNAASNATVTINLQPTTRKGAYFSKQLTVANSSSAVYTQLVTVGVLKNAGSNMLDIVTSTTGKVFVAKSPEPFGYDVDGNLTNDGRFAYTCDAENRLIQVQTLTNLPASVPQQKLFFGYDSQSRRISKVVSNWNGSAWVLGSTLKFVYDGWSLFAELNATNGLVRSYTWGIDLSGSPQGAAGIGGLLLVSNHGSPSTNSFVACDGNGNVVSLVNAAGGVIAPSQYEYGPFGETLRATGPLAKANPFRFSTKYTDAETGLLYCNHRYYQASWGRWTNRDLAEEDGGLNLYGFVRNDPLGAADGDGLRPIKITFDAFIPRRLGEWLPEPLPFSWLPDPWEFHTDNRGFGGGSARIRAEASVESTRLGQLTKGDVGFNGVRGDGSTRRRIKNHAIQESKGPNNTGDVQVKNQGCCTEVVLKGEGSYPFYYGLGPDIGFRSIWKFCRSAKNKVKVELSGNHVRFPNFEGLLDGKVLYPYDTPYRGPGFWNLNLWHSFSGYNQTVDAETP